MTISTNDAQNAMENINAFLAHMQLGTELGYEFCTPASLTTKHNPFKGKEWNSKKGRAENKGQTDSGGIDVYVYHKETPNIRARIKFRFIFDNVYRNEPKYNYPYDIHTKQEMLHYLKERDVYFCVILFYGAIEFPRMFWLNRYDSIREDQWEEGSRYGKRMDYIYTKSDVRLSKFSVVGEKGKYLLNSLLQICK